MERWREGFHQKGKIYKQDVFSWCIQGSKLESVIAQFDPVFFLHVHRKEKKAQKNLIKRQKYRSINSPPCPALWFVYILMHSKGEWVLEQLVSQHKCAEWPVWPFCLVTIIPMIFQHPSLTCCIPQAKIKAVFTKFVAQQSA